MKAEPLQAMLAAHQGPVLGLHPMFGPDSGSLAKQVVVYCDGRQPEAYQWFLEQIQVWGARLHRISAVEHDQNHGLIFRLCATLPPSPMACTWRKRMYVLSNCWRSRHPFTDWSWRW
ncbi:Chorismate mutase I [Klebsiella pneumoniae subsp. ozaenae]|uniref:Chorismate mutase I n=1 Tax=Klebsiella pneumoniae subsp. ozaenae TaxID=574 RepID=A0A378ACT4_KLEPO|nr:Chorismate mutase I [Klebsiella pneumoniae subsp. ozaenae]